MKDISEIEKILEWAYKTGYNQGLCSQKLFQIREYIKDKFSDIVCEENEYHVDEILLDINYCMELLDNDSEEIIK